MAPSVARTSPDCAVCAQLASTASLRLTYPAPTKADERERLDRIRGCLFGGAIGDAIGRLLQAKQPIPEQPAPRSLPVGGATQLALFTAEGVLRMLVRYHAKGIGPAYAVVKHAYDRWLFTQGDAADILAVRTRWSWGSESWPDGWLVGHHELHHRRSAMHTTCEALRLADAAELEPDRHLHPRPNHSAGAGALVHAAPVGLFFSPTDPQFAVNSDDSIPHVLGAFEMGVRSAGYTHGHPDAFLSAGILSALVAHLVRGAKFPDALGSVRGDLLGWPGAAPFREVMEAIAAGAPPNADTSPAVRALVIGAHAAQRARDPMGGVMDAATGGGTAAAVIAAQVLGVTRGVDSWPASWQRATEVSDVASGLADAVGVAHRAWVMDRRIPGAEWQPGDDDFEPHPVSRLLIEHFPGW